MTRSLLATGVFVGLAVLGASTADARPEEYPRVHVALFEMREAVTELKSASHDFGGHRAKAQAALEEAVSQVEKALQAVGQGVRGSEPGKVVYKSYANHPHIRHALAVTKEARDELKAAPHDFKGHREKAIQALNAATEQLELALKFAR
jgi:hypothetical protein